MMKLACLTLFICCLSYNVHAEDATATFKGNIVAGTCSADGGGVSEPIIFRPIRAANLQTANTGGEWQHVKLTLSGCTTFTNSVTVTFTGTAPSNGPNYYVNTGTATNVVLELTNVGHTVSYGSGSTEVASVDASRNAVFNLSARMYAPNGMATVGTFISVVQVNFQYN